MVRCITAIVVGLSLVAAVSAQPLADRVPQDAVVYFGWRGSDHLGPAYQASHLKGMLDNSRLREVFQEFLPRLAEKIAEEDEEAGEIIASMLRVNSIMWRNPSAFMFNGLGEDGTPRVALICQAGDEAQALHDELANLLELAEDVPLPISAFIAGDIAGIAIGYEDGAAALAGGEGAAAGSALSASEGLNSTIERMQADPVVVLYIDAQRVLQLIDQAIEANDPDAAAKWAQARDASGLSGVKRLVHTATFEGKDWVSYTLIDAPAPRRGLVSMLDSTPLPDDLLKAVPASATFAAAGGFHVARFVVEIRALLGAVDPEAQKQMDQGLGIAQMAIGRDPQKEILEPLGEHWLAYTSPRVGGNGLFGIVIVNQLDDAKKAQQGLESLWLFMQNWLAGEMADEDVSVRGLQTKIGELSVQYLGIPLVAPSWAIKDGRLYAGLFPQTIASAAEQAAGDKSILENEEFQKLRKRLAPDKKLTGFTFIDLEATAPETYQSVLAIARLALGFADLFGVQAPEPVIPPLHVLLSHLSPAGAVSWVDETGWHRKSITPFPGAGLLASQQLVAVGGGAMAASIMLPSLNRARETANRVKCASNMRQIGQAMLLYANENRGNYPPDLGTLVLTQDITPEVFVCPSGFNAVPPEIREAPIEQQAQWVNENADYVYLGAGKRSDAGAEEVMLHEHLHHHEDGMNMLFGDGHVEFIQQHFLEHYLEPGEDAVPDMEKL